MWHGRPARVLSLSERLHYHMNVVRHDAPCCQRIPRAVKMKERVLYQTRNSIIFHETRTIAVIEITLDPFRVKLCQPPLFVLTQWPLHLLGSLQDVLALEEPGFDDVLRKRIPQAKGNAVPTCLSGPMWKISAATFPDRGTLILHLILV